MADESHPIREIPYNYTSADDRQAVSLLLGEESAAQLETLKGRRVTGQSLRLLMRCLGDVLIHRRNPFLYQELLDSPRRRRRLFRSIDAGLKVAEQRANGDALHLEVVTRCRALFESFRDEVANAPELRRKLRRALDPILGEDNVLFDPFTVVSHATDATDWRLFLPFAVVLPTEESQVGPALAAIAALGLKAIPRGAGTGLTGGAVPVRPGCVILNTERLNRIRGIETRRFTLDDGREVEAQVMALEAGVITEHAIEHAAAVGQVFATDPTSAWASTIGGNIAENAGGKTGVLWGTAIDNLLAWRMAMPDGSSLTVRRLGHPLRKILPKDALRFEVTTGDGRPPRILDLGGGDIRKKDLWKDITNKALGGLPGIQKEGTDGVITSAEFVLYEEYARSTTFCLEFFGADMDEASRVILELSEAYPNRGEEVLRALEHFDDQYVRAIGYQVKAPRAETPKAVLLIDLVGHDAEQIARGSARLRKILEGHHNTHLFEARDAAEAKRFWADRKKLGAIAARTNAFKLNEDIVLPLRSLAAFSRFVDAVNLEEERYSQTRFVERADALLRQPRAAEDPEWFAEKVSAALSRCQESLRAIREADEHTLRSLAVVDGLRRELSELLRGCAGVLDGLEALHRAVRTRLLVIATHMHAGDGNVHVNIPILSNDRPMMKRAEQLVDRVMEKVVELGGVVSGEHGIGITKLKYLERERVEELKAYRAQVDPAGTMNPGKLEDLGVLEQVFTPSFNLLELEARILQHGSLEQLASKIAACVRCGRCKSDCCVFHPARALFFHPRNKNLAIGSLIEALLYDAQRQRSTNFQLLRHLEQVADHCTICHKCAKPCPVAIDSGEVSALERQLLAARHFKHMPLATRMVLRYLESRSATFNRAFRPVVLRAGAAVQRGFAKMLAGVGSGTGALARSYPAQLLRSPMPAPDPKSLHDLVPFCQPDQVLVFEPQAAAEATVFYFPGCGSERLSSQVSMAAISVLLELKTRVVLPPPYLCCGFPHFANARTEQHGRTVLRDTILFSQIKEMFGYLRFDACVVTCGTCRSSLQTMQAGQVFGCEVVDLVRFAQRRGLSLQGETRCLYHAPCHDSLDGKAVELMRDAAGYRMTPVPHCCSEAGTLAMSRPDIADAMRDRKCGALREALEGRERPALLLTNCPMCLQGLGRSAEIGIEPRHLAVELARRLCGEDWRTRFVRQAAKATAQHF